jgi:hypothetical protein
MPVWSILADSKPCFESQYKTSPSAKSPVIFECLQLLLIFGITLELLISKNE